VKPLLRFTTVIRLQTCSRLVFITGLQAAAYLIM